MRKSIEQCEIDLVMGDIEKLKLELKEWNEKVEDLQIKTKQVEAEAAKRMEEISKKGVKVSVKYPKLMKNARMFEVRSNKYPSEKTEYRCDFYRFHSESLEHIRRVCEDYKDELIVQKSEYISTGVKIRYVTSEGQEILCGIDEITDKLGPYFNQSAYGDFTEGKTKVDEKVRKSRNLNGCELVLGTEISRSCKIHPDNSITDVREDIRKHSFKEDVVREISERMLSKRKIELIPHSLIVYEKGEFFKTHVDTPRHDPARMVGTVVFFLKDVVGINVNYPGHPKTVTRNYCPKLNSDNVLEFLFFFGDCPHSVSPNPFSNPRITLTYDVLLKDATIPPSLSRSSLNLLKLVARYPGRPLIFCLSNHYTKDALDQQIMKSEEDVETLQRIRDSGLDYTIEEVIIHAHQNRVATEGNEIDFDEDLYTRVDEFGYKDSEYEMCESDRSYDELKLIVPEGLKNPCIFNPFRCVHVITETIQKSKEVEYGDDDEIYTGNQYDEGIALTRNGLYTTAAIIIRF